MPAKRNVVTLLLGAVIWSVLAGTAGAQNKPKVVATFSILGDLVRNVGGERIELTTLVGPDGDGHVYSPTPADGRRLAEAKLIFVNGLRFEGWVNRLVKSSGTKAKVVEAAQGVRTIKAEVEHGRSDAHGHDHGAVDPHAWQDVANAKVYIANIRDALIAADPVGKTDYEKSAADYLARLEALDAEVKAAVEGVAPERRKVITGHDSFAYFEKAYGLDFIAPQGVSTEAEASARDVARIIRQVKREGISAVFLENVSDARLVERIAQETGAKVGGRLYSDALSPADGPAGTYIDMMRHNIRALSQALSS